MILDCIENLVCYGAVNRNFAAVAEYLSRTDLKTLDVGEYEIVPGGEAFVRVMDIKLRPAEEIPVEFHQEYIDIQIPISGVESIGWLPLRDAVKGISAQFDEKKDCAVFMQTVERWIAVKPGEFIVLAPADAHAPGRGTGMQRKAVIKVRV